METNCAGTGARAFGVGLRMQWNKSFHRYFPCNFPFAWLGPAAAARIFRLGIVVHCEGVGVNGSSGQITKYAISLTLTAKIAGHIIKHKVRRTPKFAVVLQLEPLHTCNL